LSCPEDTARRRYFAQHGITRRKETVEQFRRQYQEYCDGFTGIPFMLDMNDFRVLEVSTEGSRVGDKEAQYSAIEVFIMEGSKFAGVVKRRTNSGISSESHHGRQCNK